MLQTNEIYLNGKNSTIQIASAHETGEVKVYEHPLFGRIRMFVKGDKTWFCGTDIATSLGYSNARKAILDHCKSNGVTIRDVIDSMGRTQQMKFISEGNIYRLTAKSQMPKADEFESWIFDEVVPTIIKTGNYSTHPQLPKNYLEALEALVESEKEKQRLELENKHLEDKTSRQEPLVSFAKKAFKSDGKVDVGQVAKILNLGYGRTTLFKKLRETGIFFKNRNEPKQQYIDNGCFELKEHLIERKNHPDFTVVKVIVTQKGIALINKILGGTTSDGKLARIA